MTVTLSIAMVNHEQVSVFCPATGTQRTYPTIAVFLRWLDSTHQRIVERGGTLLITLPKRASAHPADLILREQISESSAGQCLA